MNCGEAARERESLNIVATGGAIIRSTLSPILGDEVLVDNPHNKELESLDKMKAVDFHAFARVCICIRVCLLTCTEDGQGNNYHVS